MSEPGLVIYRFSVGLFYANAERFSEEILGLVSGPQPPRWFVLDAVAIDDVDYTGGQTLSEIADQLAERKIVLAIAEASPRLRVELDRFGVTARIGADHYFEGIEAAREAFRASHQA